MSKKIYIGVDNKARRVKKIYIGLPNDDQTDQVDAQSDAQSGSGESALSDTTTNE